MKKYYASLIFLGLLTACGGGGSGGGSNSGNPNNLLPVVDAGSNRTANSGEQIDLIGSATDSDGSIVEVQWSQTGGTPIVQIQQANSLNASFFAPEVSSNRVLTFSLRVTDSDNATVVDTVSITLIAPASDLPPVISEPLPTARVNTGETVTLTAEAVDPDGTIVSFNWEFLGATPPIDPANEPVFSGNNDDTAAAQFVAPVVTAPTTLRFQLTVEDNAASTNTDTAQTTVLVYPVPQTAAAARLYVLDSAGLVSRFNSTNSAPREFSSDLAYGQFDAGNGAINKAIALTADGRMVQADDNDENGITEVCAIGRRAGNDQFDLNRDRRYDHDFDDLGRIESYSGVAVAHRRGYVIAIDTFSGAGSQDSRAIHVYGSAVAGTRQLVADIPLGGNGQDLYYDDGGDRLFVTLANGRIAVFNRFIEEVEITRQIVENNEETAGGPAGGNIDVDALIIIGSPGDASTEIGRSLRGIEYHAASDRLIVSDVGEVADANTSDPVAAATDGAIYILSDATQAANSGFGRAVAADAVITGSSGAAALGDPNDIALNGRDLVVADSANGRIYVYQDVFVGFGARTDAPVETLNSNAPQYVAVQALDTIARPHANDLGPAQGATPLHSLLVARQFDDGGNRVAQLLRVDPELDTVGAVPTFQIPLAADEELAGVATSLNGDVYVSRAVPSSILVPIPGFPGDPASTLVNVVNSGAKNRLDGTGAATTTTLRDRSYTVGTTVQDPRAALIIDSFGVQLFADAGVAGDRGIVITTLCGEGGVLGGKLPTQDKAPTDLDYDERNGDLYISFADGDFGIFRAFNRYLESLLANPNTPVTPNPLLVVTPTVINPDGNRGAAASSFSAIEYLPVLDQLALTSENDIGSNTDGQLFILGRTAGFAASQLFGGTVDVNLIISGPSTMLGRPIDLAFDGFDLYVADRGNGAVLKFNNVESILSGGDRPPSRVFAQTGVRAIVPVAQYVGGEPNDRQQPDAGISNP